MNKVSYLKLEAWSCHCKIWYTCFDKVSRDWLIGFNSTSAHNWLFRALTWLLVLHCQHRLSHNLNVQMRRWQFHETCLVSFKTSQNYRSHIQLRVLLFDVWTNGGGCVVTSCFSLCMWIIDMTWWYISGLLSNVNGACIWSCKEIKSILEACLTYRKVDNNIDWVAEFLSSLFYVILIQQKVRTVILLCFHNRTVNFWSRECSNNKNVEIGFVAHSLHCASTVRRFAQHTPCWRKGNYSIISIINMNTCTQLTPE